MRTLNSVPSYGDIKNTLLATQLATSTAAVEPAKVVYRRKIMVNPDETYVEGDLFLSTDGLVVFKVENIFSDGAMGGGLHDARYEPIFAMAHLEADLQELWDLEWYHVGGPTFPAEATPVARVAAAVC